MQHHKGCIIHSCQRCRKYRNHVGELSMGNQRAITEHFTIMESRECDFTGGRNCIIIHSDIIALLYEA